MGKILMSLRGQFVLSVVLALLLGFAVETAVAARQAERTVQNEMGRALATANDIVADAAASLPATDRDPYLVRLVRGFDGDRHIRLILTAEDRVIAASRPAPREPVPAWFVRILSIPSETVRRALLGGFTLILSTDPHNEISESWGQLSDGVLALLLFSGFVLLLLSLAMARTVRPLERLNDGCDALGSGDYAARVDASGPRELSRLAAAFNRMAARLEALEASNRRLSDQMLVIQEEERADLARDLHDEMGPLLFSLRLSAAGIAAETPDSAVATRVRAIEDAAARMQTYLREILTQLRPDECFDLGQAIRNLALFWRGQHGDVQVRLEMADESGFGAERDAAIFRLVQEGLTNAVRHGGAKNIAVVLARHAGRIVVRIEDDGRGLAAVPREGMGLKGMRERLAGFSGRLSLAQSPGGGACLIAELDCPDLRHQAKELI